MSRTQTICVNSTPGDATAAANVVAESIRATGKVVTIGTEYSQPYGHKAGMLAVDLTIDDAPAPLPQGSEVIVAVVAEAAAKIAEENVAVLERYGIKTEEVPFDHAPDLSQGPNATDDDGNITNYRREKREKKARNQ